MLDIEAHLPMDINVMALLQKKPTIKSAPSKIFNSLMSMVNTAFIILFWIVIGVFYIGWRRQISRIKKRSPALPEHIPLKIKQTPDEADHSQPTESHEQANQSCGQRIWPILNPAVNCFTRPAQPSVIIPTSDTV
jgi:hypothetical protein